MNASLFYISQLLGYRIFRWLFNFTKFWWYKVTYYNCLALFAGDVSCYFLVGQGPPRPVLHDEKIYWVLEDVARRPPSYYG